MITATRSASSGLRLLTHDDLENLEPLSWTIANVLPQRGMVILYGRPGSGKSFCALSMALAIADGAPWFGRRVEAGPVVYVAAEGGRGLRTRVAASSCPDLGRLEDRKRNFFALTTPVQLMDRGAVNELIAAVKAIGDAPSLIVIDTLARSMVGGDENATKDMCVVVDSLAEIGEGTGATLLVVHHSVKSGASERGSSALRAAADTSIRVQKCGRELTLICDKQKDAAEFDSIRLELLPVPVPRTGESGPTSSCRLILPGATTEAVPPQYLQVLQTVRDLGATDWVLRTDVVAAGVSQAMCTRAVQSLAKAGLVEIEKCDRGHRIRVTPNGVAMSEYPYPAPNSNFHDPSPKGEGDRRKTGEPAHDGQRKSHETPSKTAVSPHGEDRRFGGKRSEKPRRSLKNPRTGQDRRGVPPQRLQPAGTEREP